MVDVRNRIVLGIKVERTHFYFLYKFCLCVYFNIFFFFLYYDLQTHSTGYVKFIADLRWTLLLWCQSIQKVIVSLSVCLSMYFCVQPKGRNIWWIATLIFLSGARTLLKVSSDRSIFSTAPRSLYMENDCNFFNFLAKVTQ